MFPHWFAGVAFAAWRSGPRPGGHHVDRRREPGHPQHLVGVCGPVRLTGPAGRGQQDRVSRREDRRRARHPADQPQFSIACSSSAASSSCRRCRRSASRSYTAGSTAGAWSPAGSPAWPGMWMLYDIPNAATAHKHFGGSNFPSPTVRPRFHRPGPKATVYVGFVAVIVNAVVAALSRWCAGH